MPATLPNAFLHAGPVPRRFKNDLCLMPSLIAEQASCNNIASIDATAFGCGNHVLCGALESPQSRWHAVLWHAAPHRKVTVVAAAFLVQKCGLAVSTEFNWHDRAPVGVEPRITRNGVSEGMRAQLPSRPAAGRCLDRCHRRRRHFYLKSSKSRKKPPNVPHQRQGAAPAAQCR
jgi:hypothetical protein